MSPGRLNSFANLIWHRSPRMTQKDSFRTTGRGGRLVADINSLRFARSNRPVIFDYQPTLTGDLLQLRPLSADDFDGLYAVARDPLIWDQHPAKERCEEVGFENFFRESLASGGALIAMDAATGAVIGSSRFNGFNAEESEVEIGWTFLARSHWGGQYNGEMKRLMLRHAFRFVNSVVFLVHPRNFRSQRAVEKIGGVRDGSRPDAAGRESFVYRITAADIEVQ